MEQHYKCWRLQLREELKFLCPRILRKCGHKLESSPDHDKEFSSETDHRVDEVKDFNKYKDSLKRFSSASLVGIQTHEGGSPRSEFHTAESEKHGEGFLGKSSFDMVFRREAHVVPKLRCRVCTFLLILLQLLIYTIVKCKSILNLYNIHSYINQNGFQVVIDGIFWCASFIQFDCCLLSTCTLQVLGAYFEKLGSTSFAVYSIAVTDGQEKTWFVRRR